MSKEKDYLKFQLRRKITTLFKNFFFLLEDLNLEDEKYQKLRKRVLDYGNDTIREIEEDINKFDIHI
jgi:hypothetical protein